MCGGTDDADSYWRAGYGLSPRVRGNLGYAQAALSVVGSIPACAGEPQDAARKARGKWVYPRVCGGTARRTARRATGGGLSPRVRGNRGLLLSPRTRARSIPACAGEPEIRERGVKLVQVYPRVCGGTTDRRRGTQMQLGLSPRVRGNPSHRSGPSRGIGSIPACAGEPDD